VNLFFFVFVIVVLFQKRLFIPTAVIDTAKGSSSTDEVPPISRPGGKLPTEDASVLTIRHILKYSSLFLCTAG